MENTEDSFLDVSIISRVIFPMFDPKNQPVEKNYPTRCGFLDMKKTATRRYGVYMAAGSEGHHQTGGCVAREQIPASLDALQERHHSAGTRFFQKMAGRFFFKRWMVRRNVFCR